MLTSPDRPPGPVGSVGRKKGSHCGTGGSPFGSAKPAAGVRFVQIPELTWAFVLCALPGTRTQNLRIKSPILSVLWLVSVSQYMP